jgi:hypothetical protein
MVRPFLRGIPRKVTNVVDLPALIASAVENRTILTAPTVILKPMTWLSYKVFIDLLRDGAIRGGFPSPKAEIIEVCRHQDNSTI